MDHKGFEDCVHRKRSPDSGEHDQYGKPQIDRIGDQEKQGAGHVILYKQVIPLHGKTVIKIHLPAPVQIGKPAHRQSESDHTVFKYHSRIFCGDRGGKAVRHHQVHPLPDHFRCQPGLVQIFIGIPCDQGHRGQRKLDKQQQADEGKRPDPVFCIFKIFFMPGDF